MIEYDPHKSGVQYLEDLATGYWLSEALFTAVDMGLFTLLEPQGKQLKELVTLLQCDSKALERYLQALCTLGLLIHSNEHYSNTSLSSTYLVEGKEAYQGHSIRWRKYLASPWQDLSLCLQKGGRVKFQPDGEASTDLSLRTGHYIQAMDGMARTKATEISKLFNHLPLEGEILDVGAGSGAFAAAFLENHPKLKATLMDLKHILLHTRSYMQKRNVESRISLLEANILEPWPSKKNHTLVLLSNIVHAYAEEEISHVLAQAVTCLHEDGYLIIHDFFADHQPTKAALFDLNMLINTYNGKVFSSTWVRNQLLQQGLFVTEMLGLKTDTALLVASKNKAKLQQLELDPIQTLAASLKTLGFHDVLSVPVEQIPVSSWAELRCQFGCSSYGQKHCPPNSIPPEKTKALLQDFQTALMLEGEPPLKDFQKQVLEAEKRAFTAGYYKAFAFWAGPCLLCENCFSQGHCHRPKDARPSMEAAGIDVFATVRSLGKELKVLANPYDFVKLYGLLLLQ